MTSLNEDFIDDPETLDGFGDIEITMPREEMFNLMMEAHRRDITLNQLVTLALQTYMDKYEAENHA